MQSFREPYLSAHNTSLMARFEMTFHPLKLQNETYQYISLESGLTDVQI